MPRKHHDVAATFGPLRLQPRGLRARRVHSRIQSLSLVSGALEPLVNLAQRTPLALERVVYPCHSMNCGDIIYKRCVAFFVLRDGMLAVNRASETNLASAGGKQAR